MLENAQTVAIRQKFELRWSYFLSFLFYKFINKLKKIAEKIVGITRFFLDKIKITTHITTTTNLIIRSDSAKTPAGKIIILPNNAAKVEYATQLNHWNSFDLTLTFSDVSAPINLEINVAKEVAIIANIIIWLLSIFFSK